MNSCYFNVNICGIPFKCFKGREFLSLESDPQDGPETFRIDVWRDSAVSVWEIHGVAWYGDHSDDSEVEAWFEQQALLKAVPEGKTTTKRRSSL